MRVWQFFIFYFYSFPTFGGRSCAGRRSGVDETKIMREHTIMCRVYTLVYTQVQLTVCGCGDGSARHGADPWREGERVREASSEGRVLQGMWSRSFRLSGADAIRTQQLRPYRFVKCFTRNFRTWKFAAIFALPEVFGNKFFLISWQISILNEKFFPQASRLFRAKTLYLLFFS